MNEKSDERPVRTMYRSPNKTQKDVSELIQRYENEKKAQEELAKEYEENFSKSQGPTWYQVSQKKSEVVKQPSTHTVKLIRLPLLMPQYRVMLGKCCQKWVMYRERRAKNC